MSKKRHNIDTIAEVLIDSINDFKKDAERIEKVVDELKKTRLSVDTTKFDELIEKRNVQEIAFLIDSEKVQAKRQARLPNWLLTLIIGLFLSLIGFSFYVHHQLKKVSRLEKENSVMRERLDLPQDWDVEDKN